MKKLNLLLLTFLSVLVLSCSSEAEELEEYENKQREADEIVNDFDNW